MQNKQQNLPIGYWIKKADELLTININQVHQDANLTRVGWQLLHTINEYETINATGLITMIHPFADEREARKILADLKDKNFIRFDDDTNSFSLTHTGKQLYKDCLEKQQAIRQKAMAGIGEEAYIITLQTLQKISNNLENK